MKKCSKCGKEANSKFCPDCGAEMIEIEAEPVQSVEPETKPEAKLDGSEPAKYTFASQDNSTKENFQNAGYELPVKEYGVSGKTWFVILFLIIFWPVGLYLMWSRKKFTKVARIVITVVIGVLFVIGFATTTGDDNDTISQEPTNATEEATEAETTAPTQAAFDPADYTAVPYDSLARTPDDYEYSAITGSGRVIQVIEDTDEIQLRVAVGDNYDTIMLVGYDPSIVDSRILEEDYITYYGTSAGIITYESTIGGNISIPAMYADKIVLQ